MPAGIQVWDAAGNLILDTSYRTGFILGSVAIGASNQSGSQSDANLALGVPFFIMTSNNAQSSNRPDVSFSGTTITWTATVGGFTGRLFWGIR